MNDPYGKYLPPFAFLFLSSYLEAHGISTDIIDIKERRQVPHPQKDFERAFFKTVIDRIKRDSPLLVGTTCYTAEYKSVMELITNIKNEVDIKIVVGGTHATLKPEDFIYEGSPVDFAVCGDGETPLLKLFGSLSNNDNSYKDVEGIAYLDPKNDRELVCNGTHVEVDITNHPMPDYSKIDMNFYTEPSRAHIRFLLLSGTQIFTSRGCPYSCEFCAVGILRSKNKKAAKMRYRSLDQVIEEIELLRKDYKIDCFYTVDDCFMTKKDRTREFCEKLLSKNLGLIWGAETRADYLREEDEGLLKLMKRAGLVQLDFGVESGSPAMLREIKKNVKIDQVKTAFELCKKNGIRTYANIMYNLPNETVEDVELTNKMIDEIKPTIVGAATTVPLLGTPLYEKYFHPKLQPSEYGIYNESVYDEIVDERFRLSKHDLDVSSVVKKINRKYYYNPFKSITFKWFYWKTVLKSHYSISYLKKFLGIFLTALTKKLVETVIRIDNLLFDGLIRRTVKRFLAKAHLLPLGK
jgi:radical SAM superfamily enzyme YgiQ (UPF0313 family)